MNKQPLFLVIADATLARDLTSHLARTHSMDRIPIATNASLACRRVAQLAPAAILFDESALIPPYTLKGVVAGLSRYAPVVALAGPERQSEIAELAGTGGVDFVARVGDFVPLAASLLERQARIAHASPPYPLLPPELAGNFAEVLRHEMNNPLTGILGNAELLLARREQLAPADLRRLETIAQLAVRLRETVRRLSRATESPRSAVHSA